MQLSELNIRQLQLYAAVCLWKYCNTREISHDAIGELVGHLVSMATAESLPDWEQHGTKLLIVGRGEPIPKDVLNAIAEADRRPFADLVEFCVEVGVVDMYGETTDQPLAFVNKCLDTLERERVKVPTPHEVASLGGNAEGWGKPYMRHDVERVLHEYGMSVET